MQDKEIFLNYILRIYRWFRVKTAKKETLLVVLFLAIAFVMRIYKLYESYGFYGDQGKHLLSINEWFTSNKIPLRGPRASVGKFHKGPFYFYIIAPFLLAFDSDPIGPVYMHVIVGVLTIGLGYYLLRKYWNTNSAMIFLILTSLSPRLIFLSQGMWDPNLLPFITLLLLVFLYRIIMYGKRKDIFFCFLFVSIGSQMHHTFLSHLLSITASLLLLKTSIFKKTKFWKFAFLGLLIPQLPFLYGQLRFYDFVDIKEPLKYLWQTIRVERASHLIDFHSFWKTFNFAFNKYLPLEFINPNLNFLKHTLYILITIGGLIVSFKNSSKGRNFFEVTIIVYIVSLFSAYAMKLNFYDHYHDYYTFIILIVFSILLAKMFNEIRFKVVAQITMVLVVISGFPRISNLYRPARSPRVVEGVSEILIHQIRNQQINEPVAIYVKSPVTLKEGYEYRYLLEKSGINTISSKIPKNSTFIIIESEYSAKLNYLMTYGIQNIKDIQVKDNSSRIQRVYIYQKYNKYF